MAPVAEDVGGVAKGHGKARLGEDLAHPGGAAVVAGGRRGMGEDGAEGGAPVPEKAPPLELGGQAAPGPRELRGVHGGHRA